jgi:hypothetical protein
LVTLSTTYHGCWEHRTNHHVVDHHQHRHKTAK